MLHDFLTEHRDALITRCLGLGLAISRRSVEANGGTLSVRNLPGTGCVFTIDLPGVWDLGPIGPGGHIR